MPVQQCKIDGRMGWRWGRSGKCYVGDGAKAKAERQGRAVRASGYTENEDELSQRVHIGSVGGNDLNSGNLVVGNTRTKVVPSNPLKADPTRTKMLRDRFVSEFRKRFRELKGRIRRLVVEEDAFGLKQQNQLPGFNERVVNTRWRFRTDQQKVEEFRNWLEQQVGPLVLQSDQASIEDAYYAYYAAFVEAGYRKGAGRAFDDVRKPALASGRELDFFDGTKQEFLRQSFARPETIEKVKLLTGRVFTDLKGVTDTMAAQMSRTLAEGLVQGRNPRDIARILNDRVDKIGITRSTVIARTEIIRAHAEGQLDAMENLGVTEVGVMVEWSTAGDDRVCPLCQPMDGVVFTIKEARGLIPRHPQCRCAHIPANVGEPTAGQKRSRSEIRGSVRKSVKAEPGGGSLAAKRRRSDWAGADKTISKDRPKSILDASSKTALTPKPIAPVSKRTVSGREVLIEKLNQAEIKSVREYQQGLANSEVGGFSTIQKYLRDNKIPDWKIQQGITPPKVQEVVRGIDSAIKKSKAAGSTTVFRGIRDPLEVFKVKNLGEIRPGLTFVDDGYVSTSASENLVKKKFSTKLNPWESPKVLHIEVQEGQSLFPVDIVKDVGEKEFVLPRGTEFEITKVSGNNIHLKIIGK